MGLLYLYLYLLWFTEKHISVPALLKTPGLHDLSQAMFCVKYIFGQSAESDVRWLQPVCGRVDGGWKDWTSSECHFVCKTGGRVGEGGGHVHMALVTC
jgi:hypothetical protein